MKRVYIAVGNPLRGDDGVGRRVLERVRGRGRRMYLHQLTPEVAADLESADQVIFIDADVTARSPRLEAVQPDDGPSNLSHTCSPSSVIHLARELYEFKGEAYLCHVPAREFPVRMGLSKEAESQSHAAADLLSTFMNGKTQAAGR